jgi:hypothetical protein
MKSLPASGAKNATHSNIPAVSTSKTRRTTLETNLALCREIQDGATNSPPSLLTDSKHNPKSEPLPSMKWEDREVITIDSDSEEDATSVHPSKQVAGVGPGKHSSHTSTNAVSSLGTLRSPVSTKEFRQLPGGLRPRHSANSLVTHYSPIGVDTSEVRRPPGGLRPRRIANSLVTQHSPVDTIEVRQPPGGLRPRRTARLNSNASQEGDVISLELGLLTPVAGSKVLVDVAPLQGIVGRVEQESDLRVETSVIDVQQSDRSQINHEKDDLPSVQNLNPSTPFYLHTDPISGAISFHRFPQNKRKADEILFDGQSSDDPPNEKRRVLPTESSELNRLEAQETQQSDSDLTDIEVLERAINSGDNNIHTEHESVRQERELLGSESDSNNAANEVYENRRLRHEEPHYCPAFPTWGLRFPDRGGPQTLTAMVRNATHSRHMWEQRHKLPLSSLPSLPPKFQTKSIYIPPDEWINQPGTDRNAYRAENSQGKAVMTWEQLKDILVLVTLILTLHSYSRLTYRSKPSPLNLP